LGGKEQGRMAGLGRAKFQIVQAGGKIQNERKNVLSVPKKREGIGLLRRRGGGLGAASWGRQTRRRKVLGVVEQKKDLKGAESERHQMSETICKKEGTKARGGRDHAAASCQAAALDRARESGKLHLAEKVQWGAQIELYA